MTHKFLALLILIVGFAVEPLLAQKVEVHPYGGMFFPGRWQDTEQIKREGIYGVQVGGFLADRWEVEGNLGYINHFFFEGSDAPKSRAFIWDVGPSINLYGSLFQKVFPFISVKAGGLTGFVGDVEDIDGVNPDAANIGRPGNPVLLSDGNTFFQFSYGGGVKAWDLWGPLGVRADVRGRTMPNFFGNSMTWLETTAGITLTFGER